MIHTTTTSQPSSKMLAIRAVGPDATKFLQGQLTCNVTALHNGQVTLGAYCNIKGKVESLFYLELQDGEYYLYLHPDLLEPTLKELKKYSVFSKVELSGIAKSLPEIINQTEEEAILAKLPQIYAQTIGVFFPHDLNLPELGAVSFTKGCYRGQEIVARMQHRGKLKRSLYLFSSDSDPHVNPGDAISANGTAAGTVVRASKDHSGKIIGLAVITDSLANEALSLGNSEIHVVF